ncbi:MAG: 2-oxo-3-hexenedioate decarboxylase [Pseudonocardiales bacterium]|jgi:2-oxo-3-hexenedioate decarboxylase|nr:2-oxo-3-hexenedioate decarboxylase [Pseudonocardiales bacterium]MDT4940243.1 2-oxo-3-hexenedioate decarboxylase [Pseudonocardiales bacterium]
MSASNSELLDAAQRDVRAVDQLDLGPDLEAAYEIQRELIDRRLARGERLVGCKLGFTSQAKMTQMGVSEIIVGRLTDAMQVDDAAGVALSRFIHPRIEPEIAFRLGRDVISGGDMADCVDAVAPALEIIDSRYRDFRFSLPDVIADNTSAAAFVVGEWQPMRDVADLPVRLLVDGIEVEAGSTAAILGHPLRALEQLVDLAARYGIGLNAGDVILAGAATAAVRFGEQRVIADVRGLGTAAVRGIE